MPCWLHPVDEDLGGQLRSVVEPERRLVQILERPTGPQFAPFQRPEVVSSFVFSDTTSAPPLAYCGAPVAESRQRIMEPDQKPAESDDPQ